MRIVGIRPALRAGAMVPRPLDAQKDGEVPVAAELRPVEEDAVEEQDGAGGGSGGALTVRSASTSKDLAR
jgi:hypothetical protein